MDKDKISKEVEERFKKLQEKKVKGGKRSKTVHASHITGECVRRPWYDFRETPEPLTYDSICNFWAGTILHENAPLGGRNEVPLSANIKTMQPIGKKDINDYNLFDCITGTADDILEFEGDIVIADKKTFSTLSQRGMKKPPPTEPDKGYVAQLNIYKLLLYICEGVEAKYGTIIYLNKATSFKDPICFTFELQSVDEIRSWVLTKLGKLRQLVEPERVITKYCNYCPHKKVCAPPQALIPKWSS